MTSPRGTGRDSIVAREVAADLIGTIIAWLSTKVREERERPEPDQALISYVRREDQRWVDKRKALRKLDEAEVEQAIAEYGAIARELNGEQPDDEQR